MHVDTGFLVCPLILVITSPAAAFWRGIQGAPEPSVPGRVPALAGSCVVIPCSFTPEAPQAPRRKKEQVHVRLRFKAGSNVFPLRNTAFNSESRDQVSIDFKGRTSLFGRPADGDCSVKMERVSLDDLRVFEVALKRHDDLLWGRPNTFHLDVVDTPEAPVISGVSSATDGELVSLNCSVSYHCPSRPPALRWRWDRGVQLSGGEPQEVQTRDPETDQPMLRASLSFTASHQVKPNLRCEVSFPGHQTVAALKDLHVTFPPKDVRVQVQSLAVQEGGSALLLCSCKADPPASEFHWSYSQHGRMVHLHRRAHTVRVYNVSRDMRVRCAAQNPIGRGESRPTPLNIQYKPVILRPSSTCAVDGPEVLCRCLVGSNPRAAVTWSVNGTVPPRDYNVSLESEPDVQTATLRGRMDRAQTVACFAFNALGNDSLTLLQAGEEAALLLWWAVPAAAVCALTFLLLILFYCCRKRAEKSVLTRRPAMCPGSLGIYQERRPLYINCTEVTHIYANGSYQLVYQNCTPLFVRAKQIRPMARRGGERRHGERRRGGGGGGMERRGDMGVRSTREAAAAAAADAETAIYLEIL